MAVILDFDELSPNGNSIAYLLDSQFLTATNNRTVSQAVVKTVYEYGIEYDDVRIFNSDNVAYIKKAFWTSAKYIPEVQHGSSLCFSKAKRTPSKLSP